MKKNILFVIPSLDAGGAEKSLISLLTVMDFNTYRVDLVLLNQKGLFLKLLPPQVNIIPIKGDYELFKHKPKRFIITAIKKLKFNLILNRIAYSIKNNVIKNKAIAEQRSWKNLKTTIHPLEKKYDAAIGYLEKSSNYFVVDKVKATKKLGFIHNDYQKLDLDSNIDKHFFKQLDYVVTVSDTCGDSLKQVFPEIASKIKVMYNIVSENLINKLAMEQIPSEFTNKAFNIVSIGRLQPQKGFDLAIEACALVKNQGINIKWFVIGEGVDRQLLQDKIEKYKLNENFILLGLKENPYTYIKNANLYAQPSRFEGKSIAIDEAKILKKPILVTNFSTVTDQITDGLNGIICEMNAKAVANALVNLIRNNIMLNTLTANLKNENLSNENEIWTLYNLINE